MQPYLFNAATVFSPLLQCQFGMRDIGRCFPFQLHRLKAVAEFTADTQVYILKMHGRRANILLFATALSHFNDNEKNPNSPTSTIHPSASQLCNSSVIACNVPSRMAGLKPVALWTSSRNLSAGMVPLGRIRAWSSFLHRPPEKDWGSGINRNKHSYNLEYQLGNIIHSMLQEQVLMHRV